MSNVAVVILLFIIVIYTVTETVKDWRAYNEIRDLFGHCHVRDPGEGCIWKFPEGRLITKIVMTENEPDSLKVRVIVKIRLFEGSSKIAIQRDGIRKKMSELAASKVQYDLIRREAGVVTDSWRDSMSEVNKLIQVVAPVIRVC